MPDTPKQPLISELTETPALKRFCVTWIQRSRDKNVKNPAGRDHNFYTAIDDADAEVQFWNTPIWKPPVKKIEIVSIEPV